MNYCCYTKDDELSKQLKNKLVEALEANDWKYDVEVPKVVITIGGDGTVLAAVHKYIDILEQVVFVGVHTGSLGFFNDYQVSEIDECIFDLLNKKPQLDKKRMVKAACGDEEFYALNEIRVENNLRTQILKVFIDGFELETFRGAGLCISTQAGATAYNRSINGAILDSDLQLWQLSEIVPVRNAYFRSLGSPLILNPDRIVEITSENFSDSVIAYDHLHKKIIKGNSITCELSDRWVTFAHYSDQMNYLKRLKTLF